MHKTIGEFVTSNINNNKIINSKMNWNRPMTMIILTSNNFGDKNQNYKKNENGNNGISITLNTANKIIDMYQPRKRLQQQ